MTDVKKQLNAHTPDLHGDEFASPDAQVELVREKLRQLFQEHGDVDTLIGEDQETGLKVFIQKTDDSYSVQCIKKSPQAKESSDEGALATTYTIAESTSRVAVTMGNKGQDFQTGFPQDWVEQAMTDNGLQELRSAIDLVRRELSE